MVVVKLDQKVFVHDAQQGGFEPDTHVDLGIDFKRLISEKGQNRLLEGIRGTGKTHILKMIVTEIMNNFYKYHVMPVYMSIAGAPQSTQNEQKFFRIYLYSSIIKEVCKFITKNKDLIVGERKNYFIERLKNLFGFDAGSEIENNIEFLLQLAEEILEDIVDNPDKVISKINSLEKDKLSGNLRISSLRVDVNSDLSQGKEKVKEYTTYKLSEISGIDSLLHFIKTTKDLLNLNYIYLLLDECSESTQLMQIEIFRLCKQVRAFCSASDDIQNPDIVFLATVYPPQGTYYPSTTKGDGFSFVPGNDCSIDYLELDELNEEFESFFEQLIERRLSLNNGGPYAISEVFENKDSIAFAAYCSGGVPRRFLEVLKQAYSYLCKDYGTDSSPNVKMLDSQYILKGVSQVIDGPTILSHPILTGDNKIVIERIIKKFSTRNKREESKKERYGHEEESTPITVYLTAAAKNAEELANLVTIGIIHDKKRSRARKSTAQSFKGAGTLYSLDIGVAVHRGAVARTPSRVLEICRLDLQKAASRGFTNTLDLILEEESLESDLDDNFELIKFSEKQILELQNMFMQGKLIEPHYSSMIKRATELLETAKRRDEKIKSMLAKKKSKSSIEKQELLEQSGVL